MPEPTPSKNRSPQSECVPCSTERESRCEPDEPEGARRPETKPRLRVQNRQRRLPVDIRRLERELARVAAREGLGGRTVSVVLVSDRRIRQLNRDFHGCDDVTDVLAFDYGANDQAEDVDAEVVVSAQRAEAEARRRGLPTEGELLLDCIHGLLHLAGYDDRERAGRRRMWRRQCDHLAQAGCTARRWQEPSEEHVERQGEP